MLIDWFETGPRRVLALVCAGCVAALCFGLYLQHVVGLEPCPMCIVQRYAMLLGGLLGGSTLVLLAAGFGAFTAARQSWLQWYPPEVASCGRDFYGMIETFPLQRVIPMIFKGSGDCAKIDWTFLGGSLANWSFVVFCVWIAVALTLIVKLSLRRGSSSQPSYA